MKKTFILLLLTTLFAPFAVQADELLLFSEDFENGIPSTWTTIDSDEDGYNWLALSDIPSVFPYYHYSMSAWAHSGNNAAASASYADDIGCLVADHWLITPQVPLKGKLTFYVASTSSDLDAYEVLASTTGTAESDFTITLQTMKYAPYALNNPTAAWEEVVINLNSYGGQLGYIAIHHESICKYFLVVDDFEIKEYVFTKDIVGYGNNDNHAGYYLIASPIGNVKPEKVTNMLSNQYDLYRFAQDDEESLEWQNYEHLGFSLEAGRGYLYANSQNVTLRFTGHPNEHTTETVTLRRIDGVEFPGWNLVGNPFAKTAYIEGTEGKTVSFYTLNDNGSEVIPAESFTGIEPMTGIFVFASTDHQQLIFNTTPPQASQKGEVILNISQGRGVIDRAIVRFDEGGQLPKFQLNPSHTKLYIPRDDNDYAVVNVGRDGACSVSTEIPINLKVSENGVYSLTVSETFHSPLFTLHLIDSLTGTDIDLLATLSYTFEAKTSDDANRFKLVIGTSEAGNQEIFAFDNDGEIVVNGTGNLQVIDMLGNILISREVNSSLLIPHSSLIAGVYVLRLVNGDDTKTQKIVVK